jgi:hypothetical protein
MRFDDIFLRRVRRRWIVWRMAESAGVCGAIAACIGLIIVPILLWRDQPALGSAIILLIIGAAAGFLWACLHRPTILQAAVEIDRQLNLHDLLSTALRFDASHDEAFAALVIRQAEARCAQISLNQLILRRMGRRGWGGIGIVWALLLSLAMLSAHPYLSEAHENISPQSSNLLAPNSVEPIAAATSAQPAKSKPLTDHPLNNSEPSPDAKNSSADATSRSASHFVSHDGDGSAAGHSNDAKNSSLNAFAPRTASVADIGLPAGGGESAVTNATDHSSIATGSAGATPSSTQPWHAGNSSADQAQAMQEIESGQVPDQYRDVVRDFFALPPKSPR